MVIRTKEKNLKVLVWKMEEFLKQRIVVKIYIGLLWTKTKFLLQNCDNCCEKELEDFTDKVYRVAITGIDMDLIYDDDDKKKLIIVTYTLIDLIE